MKITKKAVATPAEQATAEERENSLVYPSESALWEAFLIGDGHAFNLIYRHFFPILFSYGHQFTPDRELVKDAIQDLFIYLKTHRQQLGKTTSIRFYLYSSLRRALARKIKKQAKTSVIDNFPDFEVHLSTETLMIHLEEQAVKDQCLQAAIDQLTKRQKEAILYFYYEGFSYEQVAGLMDLGKAEYARKLIYRAISVLKTCLKN